MYIWLYDPVASKESRQKTAKQHEVVYRTKREAWQKASSTYQWISLGRADNVLALTKEEQLQLISKKQKKWLFSDTKKEQVVQVLQMNKENILIEL